MTIISYIVKDLKQPLAYIPVGIVPAVLLCLFLNLVHFLYLKYTGREENTAFSSIFLKDVLLFVFFLYVFILLKQAFFSRPPGSRTSVNMTFLGTWGKSPQAKAYVIENVLMFIPYGILAPLLVKPLRSVWLCTLLAALFSVLLEFAQYVTSRGHCQLDDVVMNVLGAFAGCFLLALFRRIFLFLSIPKPHK